jgi:hypothetical protein
MIDKQWYISENLKPIGPLQTQEIQRLILDFEIGASHLIYGDIEGVWKPACQWGEFESSFAKPSSKGKAELVKASSQSCSEKRSNSGAAIPSASKIFPENRPKEWILLVPGKDGAGVLQEGPFSVSQIVYGIKNRLISPLQYIWKPGLQGWVQIEDHPDFGKDI